MASASQGGWNFFLSKGDSRVGLVVVHEIFGLNPYLEGVTKSFSQAGFSAAAIDLFRGKLAPNIEEAMKLRQSVTREQLLDGLSNGIELLKREAGASKVGLMGFCMGGGFALQGSCELGADFCVDYYGMIENADDISKLKGPVLVVLAGEDERINPWVFEKLLPAAMKHKKRLELQLYPGTRHGFHRPGWEGHNPDAAADAWDKTTRFASQFK
jgi:carboxymethylenebutenolidase